MSKLIKHLERQRSAEHHRGDNFRGFSDAGVAPSQDSSDHQDYHIFN